MPKLQRSLPKPIPKEKIVEILNYLSEEKQQDCIDKLILSLLWGIGLRKEELRTLTFSNTSSNQIKVTRKR